MGIYGFLTDKVTEMSLQDGYIMWMGHCIKAPSSSSTTSFDLYRGTSLIRNNALPGPYSRNMPRVLRWS